MGVPINGRNHRGETPIFTFFARQGTHRFREYISGEGDRQRAALDLLLEAGADIHTANSEGDTLLHVVASTSRRLMIGDGKVERAIAIVERFQWLMGLGLDPSAENVNGQTSLDLAAANSLEMILSVFD